MKRMYLSDSITIKLFKYIDNYVISLAKRYNTSIEIIINALLDCAIAEQSDLMIKHYINRNNKIMNESIKLYIDDDGLIYEINENGDKQ